MMLNTISTNNRSNLAATAFYSDSGCDRNRMAGHSIHNGTTAGEARSANECVTPMNLSEKHVSRTQYSASDDWNVPIISHTSTTTTADDLMGNSHGGAERMFAPNIASACQNQQRPLRLTLPPDAQAASAVVSVATASSDETAAGDAVSAWPLNRLEPRPIGAGGISVVKSVPLMAMGLKGTINQDWIAELRRIVCPACKAKDAGEEASAWLAHDLPTMSPEQSAQFCFGFTHMNTNMDTDMGIDKDTNMDTNMAVLPTPSAIPMAPPAARSEHAKIKANEDIAPRLHSHHNLSCCPSPTTSNIKVEEVNQKRQPNFFIANEPSESDEHRDNGSDVGITDSDSSGCDEPWRESGSGSPNETSADSDYGHHSNDSPAWNTRTTDTDQFISMITSEEDHLNGCCSTTRSQLAHEDLFGGGPLSLPDARDVSVNGEKKPSLPDHVRVNGHPSPNTATSGRHGQQGHTTPHHRTTSTHLVSSPTQIDSESANGSSLSSSSSSKPSFQELAQLPSRCITNGPTQSEQWNDKYQELIDFKHQHGHCHVPNSCQGDKPLAHWVRRQRHQYRLKAEGKHSTLCNVRQQALEDLNFIWDSHAAIWEQRFQDLVSFQREHGHCKVPRPYHTNPQLAIWVKCQRRQYQLCLAQQKSSMSKDRKLRLERIGFLWNIRGRRRSSGAARNSKQSAQHKSTSKSQEAKMKQR